MGWALCLSFESRSEYRGGFLAFLGHLAAVASNSTSQNKRVLAQYRDGLYARFFMLQKLLFFPLNFP